MKMTKFTLQGKTYYLCLNAAALFAIYDRFPEAESAAEPLSASGKRGFEAVCAYLAILGTQGELVRRFEGYDKGEMPTEGISARCSLLWTMWPPARPFAAPSTSALAGR